MKKILVTTDFSTNSKSGIRFALQFASQTKCDLIFYHIFEGVERNEWNTPPINKKDKSTHDIQLEKLIKFVSAVYKDSGIEVKKLKCIVETGIDVNSMINTFVKKNNIDYICISTRGGGVINKLLGTNTSSLIQKSAAPVIVVPKNYRAKFIDNIMYSSDLSNLKDELTSVKKIAKSLLADVNVYHYDYLENVAEVRAKLDKIAQKHTAKGTFFHIKKMDIENTLSVHLQKDITKSKASLVVLFTKQNKSWYERLFLRQNTKEVIFDTKTPLLILRKK